MRVIYLLAFVLFMHSIAMGQKLSIGGGLGLGRTMSNREDSPLRLWASLYANIYYHLNPKMSVGLEVSNGGRPIIWSNSSVLDQSLTLTRHDPTSAKSNLMLGKFRYIFLQEQEIEFFAEVGIGQNKFFHRNLDGENSSVSRRNIVIVPQVGIGGKSTQITLGLMPGGMTPYLSQERNGHTDLLESIHLSVIYVKVGVLFSFFEKKKPIDSN